MLPLEYYSDALDRLNCKSGYITSDSPNHPNVIYLKNKYNLSNISLNPMDSILYGIQFNNLVLSEGSFSWWIGFLSEANNIYYNERERFWHGDMFVLPDWKPLYFDKK